MILRFYIAFVLFFLLACKKEKKEDINTETEPSTNSETPVKTGYVMMHLHTYLDNEEVDAYNVGYSTNEGRTIKLTFAQLFISEIKLVRSDGSIHNVPGKILLKNLNELSYSLGKIPVGTYKQIRFKVGLPDTVNNLNPSQSVDSLLLKQTAMWFGAYAQPDGYIFAKVQGKIDTTSDVSMNPADLVTFDYRIGTNTRYVEVIMPEEQFIVQEDLTEYLHMIVDYNALFNNLDLTTEENLSVKTVADNSSIVADRIATNIPLMFRYE